MIQSFKGMVPVIDPTAYVHPSAVIIGHVTIGADCFIGAGAVLRGDWGRIVLDNGCNIQENCVVHMFPGTTVHLASGAHVGHGAIIHGAQLGEQCMIGMNSVIMDDVRIGDGCIVGALSFVKARTEWPPRRIIVGHPAKDVGAVSDDMHAHKVEGTSLYQTLPTECHRFLKETEPMSENPESRHENFPVFDTWQARRGKDPS